MKRQSYYRLKSGHAEAIVTQLTGKLVPLTFQIFFPLSLQLFCNPLFVSLLSKWTSAFKRSAAVEIHFQPCPPSIFIFSPLLKPLLLPARSNHFICPLIPMSSIFLISYPLRVGSFAGNYTSEAARAVYEYNFI